MGITEQAMGNREVKRDEAVSKHKAVKRLAPLNDEKIKEIMKQATEEAKATDGLGDVRCSNSIKWIGENGEPVRSEDALAGVAAKMIVERFPIPKADVKQHLNFLYAYNVKGMDAQAVHENTLRRKLKAQARRLAKKGASPSSQSTRLREQSVSVSRASPPSAAPKSTSPSSNSDSECDTEIEPKVPVKQHVYQTRAKTKSPEAATDETSASTGSSSLSSLASDGSGSDKMTILSRDEFLAKADVKYVNKCPVELLPDFVPTDLYRFLEDLMQKEAGAHACMFPTFMGCSASVGITKQEQALANGLKLSREQYVESKRRLFAEKARKASRRELFRKTDAQKACRIDVNKASKLYEVFDSCGLLQDCLFS